MLILKSSNKSIHSECFWVSYFPCLAELPAPISQFSTGAYEDWPPLWITSPIPEKDRANKKNENGKLYSIKQISPIYISNYKTQSLYNFFYPRTKSHVSGLLPKKIRVASFENFFFIFTKLNNSLWPYKWKSRAYSEKQFYDLQQNLSIR